VAKPDKIDFDSYDEIPVELSGRNPPKPIETWKDSDLGNTVHANIEQAGYTKPTPVQKNALPIALSGRDLMACAQTGSGKTAAFLLPMISILYKKGMRQSYQSGRVYPVGLILSPTRELAVQIHEESRKFSNRTGLKCCVVYGGAPIGRQLGELERGCDILVATPGRLSDIMERRKVSLSQIRYLVLDEADRMLDMGFEPQIRRIVEKEDMPRTGQRQTLMFSATFPKEIQQLASEFLHDYIFLTVGRVGSSTDLITQKFLKVEAYDKMRVLVDLIRNQDKGGLTLIFTETKRDAANLGYELQRQGFPATAIHGDRSQQERTAALRSFATGRTPFLIATNVAARGLDIENVQHVINFDMPSSIEDYVHRIGRTGRAGHHGVSTAFLTPSRDGALAPKLLELLEEGHQEVPPWLWDMRGEFYQSRKEKGGRRGRFGGRDFRVKQGGVDRFQHSDRRQGGAGAGSGGGSTWGAYQPAQPQGYGGGYGGAGGSMSGGGGGASRAADAPIGPPRPSPAQMGQTGMPAMPYGYPAQAAAAYYNPYMFAQQQYAAAYYQHQQQSAAAGQSAAPPK